MLKVKQENETLTIENYQNKVSNIPFFEVLEVLEDNGITSNINRNGQAYVIYKKTKYGLTDNDICTLENCNVITLKRGA